MVEKKEKKPKYYEAEAVEKEVEKILDTEYFSYINKKEVQVLFRSGKNKDGKKHVVIKILKEPVSLTTTKKLLVLVTDEWWDENIDSDRTKGLIEAFTGITIDEDKGSYVRRDYDFMTYSDLVKDLKMDYSKFGKVLPAEKKREELVLE